jgi:D-alanine-D-alanine ligase-like ATP-grasp enzyme
MIDFKVIIEKHIEGDVHRVICIGNKLIACTKRVKGFIVGDGQSTIEKLIDQFNKHPYRGKLYQTGSAIYQIDKEATFTTQCLLSQNVNLQTVLKKDKKIYLSHKSTCGTGAEVINVTDDVCPENIQIILKAHHTLNIGVSAMDIICEDVSKPWHMQNWVFLENNSLPAIDMHHYPSIGNSVNIAKEIWDFILQELEGSHHKHGGKPELI